MRTFQRNGEESTARLRRRALLIGLAAVQLQGGCAPAPFAALRVGISPWPGFELIYLAQEQGYFREEGLEVRLLEFSSLSDTRRAYERGQVDIMACTVIEVLQAHDQEIDAAVTYPAMSVQLQRDGLAHPVFSSAEIPGEVIDVIAVEQQIARDRHADVAKFLAAIERAMAYAEQHPEPAIRIMAAREGITAQEFGVALSDGVRLLRAPDQVAYLGAAGKLGAVVDATDRILRLTSQVKGADRRAGVVNPIFSASSSRP